MKTTIPYLAITVLFALTVDLASADNAVVPGDGFAASHYEDLWTKSPFSVATPDAPDTSPDYSLVGITQLDGVAYASVVDSHTGDHFVISSEKVVRGLKLKTITRSRDGTDTFATVEKDGQPLTLKLQSAPALPIPGNPGQPPMMMPAAAQNIQNIPMPTPQNQSGFVPVNPNPPRPPRVHRPLIRVPPQPGTETPGNAPAPLGEAPAPAPTTPEAVQPHTAPPPQ